MNSIKMYFGVSSKVVKKQKQMGSAQTKNLTSSETILLPFLCVLCQINNMLTRVSQNMDCFKMSYKNCFQKMIFIFIKCWAGQVLIG